MAIDPEYKAELAERVRQSMVRLALLEAQLACASPAERERILYPSGRPVPGEIVEYADALDEAEWNQYLDEEKAERHHSEAEMEVLVAEAHELAGQEIARRKRAGNLLAS